MRKLFFIILGCATLAALEASCDDSQVQVAENLLEIVFACPSPPSTQNEMDQPVTWISRSAFFGSSSSFRVTSDNRALLDIGGAYDGQKTAPAEIHSHVVESADYRDLEGAEILDAWEGGRQFRKLVLKCRLNRACFHHQSTRDAGPANMRQSDYTNDEGYFEFCDKETLNNAKAAFDVLILTANSVQFPGVQRIVKSTVPGYINLREGPGLDRNVLVQVPAGETIFVDETKCVPGSDGRTKFPFCPANWHGQQGWASVSGFE